MTGLRRRSPEPAPLAQEARVANPVPDALTVTIDDDDGPGALVRHDEGVVWWPPSPDAVPARGDRCLVTRSDAGRLWVLAGIWTGRAP